jgi:hypothetical protein
MGGCDRSKPMMQPTLAKKYWSWPDTSYSGPGVKGSCGMMAADKVDPFAFHPWRAPGFAPVESPCGLAGGYYKPVNGFPGNGGYPPIGMQHGFDGRHMPGPTTIWPQGSKQEVAVSVNANHGGGYSYRLCPKPGKFEQLTEECFQRHPLKLSGDIQWIQWGANTSGRVAVKALRVDEGTNPSRSQWTRFPMPACGGGVGGDAAGPSNVPGRVQGGKECNRTQFPPPAEGVFGYGLTQCVFPGIEISTAALLSNITHNRACNKKELEEVANQFNVNFVDLVEVPSNLPVGEYILSWRHDCEQTPQVWASCADIKVTAHTTTIV